MPLCPLFHILISHITDIQVGKMGRINLQQSGEINYLYILSLKIKV